jgi:hypothetical protein
MNAAVTSKEEILKTSRELIRQQGWSSVSIRSVAAACGVSMRAKLSHAPEASGTPSRPMNSSTISGVCL